MSELRCLRCKTVPLTEAAQSDLRLAFFECPSCRRQYALQPGKQLTFRWVHPISLALYGVQFDESPCGCEAEVVASLVRDSSAEQLEFFTREIRLELEEPTQQVRDIVDCRASEGDLRAFLGAVVGEVEAFLTGQRADRRAQRQAEPDAAPNPARDIGSGSS
jgi:hypothetical protein